MKRLFSIATLVIFAGFVLFSIPTGDALADGTETLGPPSIPIATGTDLIAAGTGLLAQPGTITLDVPPGAVIKQVLLYWEGFMATNLVGDDTVTISNGVDTEVVTGTLIGGQVFFFSGAYSSAFRADITGLGLIGSGINTLTVEDMAFTDANNGAGIIVIIDDGSAIADIEIRDGLDLAFINFPEPRKNTVPQTFSFEPSSFDRTAKLVMFFSSVTGSASGAGSVRPSAIDVYVDGVLEETYVNLLDSLDGDEWDSVTVYPLLPAGSSELTVQPFSRNDTLTDDLPASFTWIGAGLSVPPRPELGCRVTGGGNDSSGAAADGSWDGTFAKGKSSNGNGAVNRYTFGGQAGAKTALQPQPSGEWTHHQQRGPAGSFVFHGGTASAPPGTEIDVIVCSDPGGCSPSGDPPSPAKQIDFAGLGTFKNIKNQDSLTALADVVEETTLHWFEVHIEDLGEPGNKLKPKELKDLSCPEDGSGTDAFATPAVFENADCGCGDFYRIRIYGGADNTSPIIYEVDGYINGGNFQIHHLTGYDRI